MHFFAQGVKVEILFQISADNLWKTLSPPPQNALQEFVKDKLVVDAWICCWYLYSLPSVYFDTTSMLKLYLLKSSIETALCFYCSRLYWLLKTLHVSILVLRFFFFKFVLMSELLRRKIGIFHVLVHSANSWNARPVSVFSQKSGARTQSFTFIAKA